MKDEPPKSLHYRKPGRSEIYERNGWIGLIFTLAVCVLVAFLKFACRGSL
jgi:hypothetical protein